MTDDYQAQLDEVHKLMLELEKDPVHTAHVRNLVSQLYDQLHPIHLSGSQERKLLEYAALLHDIGWAVGEKQHHKHSMRLILDASLPSLSDQEKQIVANVARYHRRSTPKLKHTEYAWLTWEDQQLVCRLAALLRVADALDRSHKGRVKQIECLLSDHTCTLSLAGERPFTEELRAVKRKKNLFTDFYGMDLQVDGEKVKKSEMAESVL